VCGQHIKCDSSQAGTVMECPTCFQKITVPQAPTGDDQKFILTGTKVMERLISARGADVPLAGAPRKFSGAAAVVLILLFMGAAAGAIYWATIIRPRQSAAQTQLLHGTNAPSAHVKPKPPKPPLVAPPASDTNWMLALNTNGIPALPVAGRIHGKDFIVERAAFQNGSLTLRWGTRGGMEFGAIINFSGAQPEELAGKTINVTTNAEKAARVTLRWKDTDGKVQKENYDGDYALHLEFGALEKNRLPGKIYLCLPDDEKSYLLGTFNADARKPKPKQNPASSGAPKTQ
jgi:hypothetical protein